MTTQEMTKYDLDACIRLTLQGTAAVNIAAEETQHGMFTQKAVCIEGCYSAVQRSSDLQTM